VFVLLLLASTTLLADDVLISDRGLRPLVVAADKRIAVSWFDDDLSQMHVVVLDGQGAMLQTMTVPVPSIMHGLCGVSNGRQFLFAWIEADDSGARLEGVLLADDAAPRRFTISDTVEVTYQGTAHFPVVLPPAVGWDGERFVAFWRDRTETAFAAEIREDGTIAASYSLTGVGAVSSATADGDGMAVVWNENTGTTLRIRFAQIHDGEVALTRTIAEKPFNPGFGTPYYLPPTIAWNSEFYCVAWLSGRSGREETLESTRVSRFGTPLDTVNGRGTVVATDFGSNKSAQMPFPYGSGFVLTWRRISPVSAPLAGVRIRPDGAIEGPMALLQWSALSQGLVNATTVAMLGDGRLVIVYTTFTNQLWLRIVNPFPRRRAARS